jgi:hypothetical protein
LLQALGLAPPEVTVIPIVRGLTVRVGVAMAAAAECNMLAGAAAAGVAGLAAGSSSSSSSTQMRKMILVILQLLLGQAVMGYGEWCVGSSNCSILSGRSRAEHRQMCSAMNCRAGFGVCGVVAVSLCMQQPKMRAQW